MPDSTRPRSGSNQSGLRDSIPRPTEARQRDIRVRRTLLESLVSTHSDRSASAGGMTALGHVWTAPLLPRGKLISTLSSPAILFADHAAPCRQALGGMLLHPLGELRGAHQAGLHRDVSEVRGGDGLLVAICRRGDYRARR
jgi:hypothetical protein